MNLKMSEFKGPVTVWVCDETKEGAINQFISWYSKEEGLKVSRDDFVREMNPDEVFAYYYDGANRDEDTIKNLIKKYCTEPDMFAINEINCD